MAGAHVLSKVRVRVCAALVTALLGVAFSSGAALANRKHASIVVDANTGVTLSQSMADELRYPASLTKMMTIYMAFEAMERGRATAQTRIKISERAAAVQPSKLNLEPGDTIALIDAVKALVVKSANDVAIAVAEHFGGTEEKFARDMTAKARQLGMRNTTFRNASGLPDDGQVTTARDMVTLGLRLQDDFPRLYVLFATREFTHNGKTYRSHNTLLGNYEGTDGIKTGYIGASGFNLVSNVKRGQKHVVAAVFGGPSAAQRNQTMRHILNLGLFKASTTKTRVPARRAPEPQAIAQKRRVAPTAAPSPQPVVAERPRAVAQAPSADTLAVPTLAQTLAPASAEPAPARRKIEVTRVRTVPVAPAPSGAPVQPAPVQAAAPVAPPVATQPPQRGAALAPSAPRLGGPGGSARQIQIQVGAHRSKSDAERHLTAVKVKAGSVLAPFQGQTIEANTPQGAVHRVRFSGFDASRAALVCNQLRQLQIDCLVTQSE